MPPKMSPDIGKCPLRVNTEEPCFKGCMGGGAKGIEGAEERETGADKQGPLAAPLRL